MASNLTYYMFRSYFSVAFRWYTSLNINHMNCHTIHSNITQFSCSRALSTWIPIIRSNCEINNYKCKTMQAVSKINLNEMYCVKLWVGYIRMYMCYIFCVHIIFYFSFRWVKAVTKISK
jgi:hypothetical protein